MSQPTEQTKCAFCEGHIGDTVVFAGSIRLCSIACATAWVSMSAHDMKGRDEQA